MSLTFTLPPVREDITPLAVPPRDACRLLSIGMSRLYDLMRSGELPSYWDGRSRRITVAYRVTCSFCGCFVGWGNERQFQQLLKSQQPLVTDVESPGATLEDWF
jgi:excisionase family DNA binding protein